MTTGIIGAMEEEVGHLQALMSIKEQMIIGDMVFRQGHLEGHNIVLVHCGIGKVNGALCAHSLINDFHVDRIMFTGVAGALSSQLSIGDIVISSDSMYHDVDATAFGYPPGQIPRLPVRSFPADPGLITVARIAAEEATSRRVFTGRVLTGDRFLTNKLEAQRLGTELGGICVEMEGAGVGQACYLNNIPYVLIRCISDRADGTAPEDFKHFSQQAASTSARIICAVLHRLTHQW